MKFTYAIVALAVASAAIAAETPFERELKQLKEQRDKATAAAVEPINRRYKESLDQLLRRATQGNDLETAIKIKAELGAAGAALTPGSPATPVPQAKPTAGALTDLKEQLPGTKWRQLVAGWKVEFRGDGTMTHGAKAGKYDAKRDKVTVTIDSSKPEVWHLSRDGKHLEKQKGSPAYALESGD